MVHYPAMAKKPVFGKKQALHPTEPLPYFGGQTDLFSLIF
jgi:hypothetical protein